jgi:protoporphyrinogen oxidase
MTVAHRLARAGEAVTLVEAAPRLGGLAGAWTLEAPDGPVVWDRHYHVTLASDRRTRGLLSELGLEGEMRWVHTRTGYFVGGRLLSASSARELVALPGLGLLDKLRIAATILGAARVRDGGRLARVDVETWLRRWSGDRAFERFWAP